MDEAALVDLMAHDNMALRRRVVELEERDRRRLSRIAGLKLKVERLQLERGGHGG